MRGRIAGARAVLDLAETDDLVASLLYETEASIVVVIDLGLLRIDGL